MTRREHEIRRQILCKLQARIAQDPFFRLYELGIEAGQLLNSGGEHKIELEQNFLEAQALMERCQELNQPTPK